ncbi:hypothetical protein ABTM10_20370, partial [Acinetobacter baumannii]
GMDSFVQDFFFRRRSGKLNWNSICSLDLDRVVSTVDIDSLQLIVENITFADVNENDFYHMSDSNFIQLFRITQLIIEY